MPDVAVIIPAYNRATQLERAVRSVLGQSIDDFELVVVDDASPESLSVPRALVENAGHRWVEMRANAGPAAARNEGVKQSNAEWISFLDSDDEWNADKLARQLEWHRRNPGLLISQVLERWCRNGRAFSKPGHLRQKGGDLFEESCRRCAIGPSCVMMTRRLWDWGGGFNERFRVCEDFELWLRITSYHSVGLVPGNAVVRKNGGHPDQLSTATPLLERHRFLALLEWVNADPEMPEKVEVAKKALLEFAQQLKGYSEKHGLTAWSGYFDSIEESCGEASPEMLQEGWELLIDNWQ